MRTICVAAALLLGTAAPSGALACSYPPAETFRYALGNATEVFVFRLEEARYIRQDLGGGAYTPMVVGRIRLMQTLFGNPTRFKSIRFRTSWCGAVNLVVGHHFLIATRSRGRTIELAMADQSVLDIEGLSDPARKESNLRSGMLLPVIRALYSREPLPSDYPNQWISERTVILPPPPPDAP